MTTKDERTARKQAQAVLGLTKQPLTLATEYNPLQPAEKPYLYLDACHHEDDPRGLHLDISLVAHIEHTLEESMYVGKDITLGSIAYMEAIMALWMNSLKMRGYVSQEFLDLKQELQEETSRDE